MSNNVQHAKATATVLEQEFRVPFRVYETTTAMRLWPLCGLCEDLPAATENAETFASLSSGRQVQVTALRDQRLRVRIPVSLAGHSNLIAEAEMRCLASSPEAVAEELARVERWAQAVLDRLCQADLLRSRRAMEDDLRQQVKNAWELNLTLERLVRHLKIHREVETNIVKVLDAALPFVGARTLVWVSHDFDSVQIRGEPFINADEARDMAKSLRRAPDLRDKGLLLCPQLPDASWAPVHQNIDSVMMMTVPSGNSFGWIIALNRSNTDATGFKHSEAAALAPFAALIGFANKACDRYQDLKELLVGLTRSLASAVDAKDPYTYGHSERVARIAVELGREMSLGDEELSDVYLAGLLHDVGKIGIRDEVLLKHGPLTPEETTHIQQHPAIGHAILKDLRQLNSLLPGVLYHHERYDGKGYPEGLVGDQIPRIARILAVADSYDAMSTTRPYRKGLSPTSVEQILNDGSGQQWDPRVIEAFQKSKVRVRSIRERGLGESLRQALDGALRDTGSSCVLPKNTVVPAATVYSPEGRI